MSPTSLSSPPPSPLPLEANPDATSPASLVLPHPQGYLGQVRLPLPVLALFLLVLGFVLPGHLEANLAHPGASWEAPPGLPTGHLDTDQPGRTLALLFLEVRDLAETTQQAEPPSSPDFSRYSPPALVLLLELPKSALEELAAWADLRAFVLERRVYQFSGTDPPADATTPNPAGASDSGGLSRVRRSAVELETRVRAFRVLDAGFALGSEAGEPRIELDRRGRVAAVRVGLVGFLDGPNRYWWLRNNPLRYTDPNGLVGIPAAGGALVAVSETGLAATGGAPLLVIGGGTLLVGGGLYAGEVALFEAASQVPGGPLLLEISLNPSETLKNAFWDALKESVKDELELRMREKLLNTLNDSDGGVYTLRDDDGIRRTGRTCDFSDTLSRHNKSDLTRDLDMVREAGSDDYAVQRGLEEMLFNANPQAFSPWARGKIAEKLKAFGLNFIRALAKNHEKRQVFRDAAKDYVRKLLTE